MSLIRISFLIVLGHWVVVSPLAGQGLGPSRIELVDGSRFEGEIVSIDGTGVVTGPGIPASLDFQEILSVKTEHLKSGNSDSGVVIFPAGGGQWLTRSPTVENDLIKFQSPTGRQELPLQTVRAIVWSLSSTIEKSILNPSGENDRIIVQTEDGERAVEGIMESIDSSSVHVNYRGESKTIGIGKVKAIIMADLDLPDLPSAKATINLVDGSQWVGTVAELKEGEVSLQVVGDAMVKITTSNIVDIAITSDRLVYLSDLEPSDVQERPMFSIKRSFQRDRSVGGRAMSIKLPASDEVVVIPKGLGTQAFSQIVFANSGEFDRFKAVVGIDAETDGRGDCNMSVWGDGVELWAQRVRASDGPHNIDLDINGIDEITLVVDPGEKFDLGDHADWGNARFLKTL